MIRLSYCAVKGWSQEWVAKPGPSLCTWKVVGICLEDVGTAARRADLQVRRGRGRLGRERPARRGETPRRPRGRERAGPQCCRFSGLFFLPFPAQVLAAGMSAPGKAGGRAEQPERPGELLPPGPPSSPGEAASGLGLVTLESRPHGPSSVSE